jgi:hypothetical protein
MSNEAKKNQILARIEKLQQTRNYAAPEEHARLTEQIERLFQEYGKIIESEAKQ